MLTDTSFTPFTTCASISFVSTIHHKRLQCCRKAFADLYVGIDCFPPLLFWQHHLFYIWQKSHSHISCCTFSQYLNTLHLLAGNTEERLGIRSTARSPPVMMSLPLKLCLQTPAKLERGITASTSHPMAGSLIYTDVRPGIYLDTVLSVIYLCMSSFTSRRGIHTVGNTDSHFLAGNNLLGESRAKGKSSESPVVRCPSQTS